MIIFASVFNCCNAVLIEVDEANVTSERYIFRRGVYLHRLFKVIVDTH